MKLYAKTYGTGKPTGKGSNERLKIELTSDKSILPFAILNIQQKDENNIHISITGNGDIKNGIFLVIPKEYSNTMTYFCDECGHIESWNATLYSEKGEPVCPNDDNDMKLQGKQQKGECTKHVMFTNSFCDNCGGTK